MVFHVVVLAVGADEGYGPTWDSDDEYDNFIRKMNPPRCALQLFIHTLLLPHVLLSSLLPQ